MDTKFWLGNLKGRSHSVDLRVRHRINSKIYLKYIKHGECRLHSIGSGEGAMAECCKHRKLPLSSMKREEFIDQLSYSKLLNNDFPSCRAGPSLNAARVKKNDKLYRNFVTINNMKFPVTKAVIGAVLVILKTVVFILLHNIAHWDYSRSE